MDNDDEINDYIEMVDIALNTISKNLEKLSNKEDIEQATIEMSTAFNKIKGYMTSL